MTQGDFGAVKAARSTILIVDDTPQNLAVLGELLRPHYHVRAANSGERALQVAQSTPRPDLILRDVMMPVMDGLTATKTIRSLERQDAKTIPIIAMTANAFREDAERCMEAGMNAHLAKPLDDEKIKQTISEELRKQNACHE